MSTADSCASLPTVPAAEPGYRPGEGFNDLLVTDEGALLLTRSQLMRVSPLAEVILRACLDRSRTLDELGEACVAALGTPPEGDVRDLVRVAVDSLVDVGALAGSTEDGTGGEA